MIFLLWPHAFHYHMLFSRYSYRFYYHAVYCWRCFLAAFVIIRGQVGEAGERCTFLSHASFLIFLFIYISFRLIIWLLLIDYDDVSSFIFSDCLLSFSCHFRFSLLSPFSITPLVSIYLMSFYFRFIMIIASNNNNAISINISTYYWFSLLYILLLHAALFISPCRDAFMLNTYYCCRHASLIFRLIFWWWCFAL